jgi:DMSO/TMAO reductase YedYZ heme-binding membrane subunit
VFVVVGLASLVLIGGLVALRPSITPRYWVIRTAALLGYLSVFLSSIASIYVRPLVRYFGRPFVKTHHIVAVTGLALLIVHPLVVAWDYGSLNVFVPLFDSWTVFLRWGGRVAWYLFAIASLVALLRTSLRKQWRAIHMLNYLAFFLATTHAVMLGSDFRSPVMKALPIAMALLVAGAFVQKRLQRRPSKAKKR